MNVKMNAVPEGLKRFFAENPRAALGFSGGCDSAYLLYAAQACGAEVTAYYVKTPFQPAFELRDARRLCDELGMPLRLIEKDVLADDHVRLNPADRCYFCKRNIFSAIVHAAAQDGYDLLIDGTNASDEASDRPGMRALAELSVRSPLREAGIVKAEVRRLSREAGLFTWNKPAYACLATRIPAGMEITQERLSAVERAEERLSGMGFSDFRVRVTPGGARVELPAAQMPVLIERREDILRALESDFDEITLNLRPRRGTE